MKKILAICFCTMLVSAYSFAEFVISPSVGYANHFVFGWDNERISSGMNETVLSITSKNSWNAVAIGLDMGFIGKSGFSFFFNNSVSLAGTLQKDVNVGDTSSISLKAQNLKGAYWDGELLAGYTFKKIPNLYITLAGGIGAGGTFSLVPGKIGIANRSIETKNLITISGYNVGLALHVEAAYYFTNNIGLALSITETPGYGGLFARINKNSLAGGLIGEHVDDSYLDAAGFVNAFHLKLGPVFKF